MVFFYKQMTAVNFGLILRQNKEFEDVTMVCGFNNYCSELPPVHDKPGL